MTVGQRHPEHRAGQNLRYRSGQFNGFFFRHAPVFLTGIDPLVNPPMARPTAAFRTTSAGPKTGGGITQPAVERAKLLPGQQSNEPGNCSALTRGQGVFKNGSRRREEADFWREKQSRLVTSVATALATILEFTLTRGTRGSPNKNKLDKPRGQSVKSRLRL